MPPKKTPVKPVFANPRVQRIMSFDFGQAYENYIKEHGDRVKFNKFRHATMLLGAGDYSKRHISRMLGIDAGTLRKIKGSTGIRTPEEDKEIAINTRGNRLELTRRDVVDRIINLAKTTQLSEQDIAKMCKVDDRTVAKLIKRSGARTEEDRTRIRFKNMAEKGGKPAKRKKAIALLRRNEPVSGKKRYKHGIAEVQAATGLSRTQIKHYSRVVGRSPSDNRRTGGLKLSEQIRSPTANHLVHLLETTNLGSSEIFSELEKFDRERGEKRIRNYYTQMLSRARKFVGLSRLPRTAAERERMAREEFANIMSKISNNGRISVGDVLKRRNGRLTETMAGKLFAEWKENTHYHEPYRPLGERIINIYDVKLAQERSVRPKLFATFEADSPYVAMESIYRRGGTKEQMIGMGYRRKGSISIERIEQIANYIEQHYAIREEARAKKPAATMRF